MKFRFKKRVGKLHIKLRGQKRVLRGGDEIDVEPHEIAHVMKSFEPVNPSEVKIPDKTAKVHLEIRKRGGAGPPWYDLIHPLTGKPVNTKALKKEEAEKLAAQPYVEPPQGEAPKTEPNADGGVGASGDGGSADA